MKLTNTKPKLITLILILAIQKVNGVQLNNPNTATNPNSKIGSNEIAAETIHNPLDTLDFLQAIFLILAKSFLRFLLKVFLLASV